MGMASPPIGWIPIVAFVALFMVWHIVKTQFVLLHRFLGIAWIVLIPALCG
jgi:hypothetical protein